MKFIIVIAFIKALAITVESIPSQGSPVSKLYYHSTVYEDGSSTIYILGGTDSARDMETNGIYTYNISTNKWAQISPESDFIPSGFQHHVSYINNNQEILTFFRTSSSQYLSDVLVFDIKTYFWSTKVLMGDVIKGRKLYSSCRLLYNNVDYMALYGGFTRDGYDSNLYLININSLTSSMQPSSGNLPGIKDSASMAYYNNTLYLYGGSYQFDELASEYGLFAYNLDIKTWTKINSTENRIKTYFHSAHIYKNYMYVLYGYMETGSYNQFWRLNFNNFIWESLGNSTGDPMEFYGFFQSGSVLTMILGISGDSFFNSINTIDFDGNFLNPKIISKNYDMPRKRKGHCMIKLQNLLFVFGGLAEDGITYLNDIWTYDPDKDLWTQLKISGILPEPRAYASCISLSGNLLLQGGKGDSISTKQYFFNYKSKVWGVINMSGGSYANRYGSCIASTESAIYIISGQISDEFTSDILVYDILTGSLSLAQNTGSIKIELAYHSCWERSGAIYVASGQDANTKPNFYIYKLFFNRLQNSVYKYRVSIVKSLTSAIGSKTSAIITGNYAVLVSGSEWNTVIFPSIFFINLDSYQITRLNLTGIYAYSYGASLYKNSIYVFGGGDHRNLMVNPDGAVNNLYKITTDHNDPIQFECSSGTNGTNCSFCSEGYYDSGNNTCIACPQGTYSNVVGATSIFQCAYCAKGTYNDIIGNFYCKECSINQVCPIGSSSGLDYYDYPQSSTQQPDSYQSNTNYVNSIYSIIQYIGISGCFVVMLFIALFHKLRQSIKKIDIFTDKHEVKLKKPIISKKTSIGGFFSILFVFIIIITISPLILTYFLDNITETKNLVPSIIYDQAISSDNFIVAFYLYQFNGICIDDQGKCYSYIYTQEVSMNYTSKTTVCSKHNGSLNGCAYKIYYQNLYLSSSSSVTLNIRQPNTFVGFIGYNITTGSSIPGQVSNIYEMIYVTDPSTVFKGNSPTVLNLDVTPSIFISYSSVWPSRSYGFHLSLHGDPVTGSTEDQNTINIYDPVLIQLNLIESNAILVTTRTINMTFYTILISLIGTVFGLMESTGSFMVLSENFFKYTEKKFKKFIKMNKLYENRDFIKKNFFKETHHSTKWDLKAMKNSKVIPVIENAFNTNYFDA